MGVVVVMKGASIAYLGLGVWKMPAFHCARPLQSMMG